MALKINVWQSSSEAPRFDYCHVLRSAKKRETGSVGINVGTMSPTNRRRLKVDWTTYRNGSRRSISADCTLTISAEGSMMHLHTIQGLQNERLRMVRNGLLEIGLECDRGLRVYKQLLWPTSTFTRAFHRQQCPALGLGHQPHAYTSTRLVQPTDPRAHHFHFQGRKRSM